MTEDTKEKKYRYTKQLVRLAIENGYTNQDIAVKAGLSPKSLAAVSRWRNGKALATERQLQHFINEFGHQLKHKMEHLFYGETETPNEFIYYKLQGEILLTHTLYIHLETRKKTQKIGLYRFVIVSADNHFHIIMQKRAGLKGSGRYLTDAIPGSTFSCNEQANWHLMKVTKNLSAPSLINEIDNTVDNFKDNIKNRLCGNCNINQMFQNDLFPLKFIVRQLLLKHGYSSDDIVDLLSNTKIINEPKQPEESLSPM